MSDDPHPSKRARAARRPRSMIDTRGVNQGPKQFFSGGPRVHPICVANLSQTRRHPNLEELAELLEVELAVSDRQLMSGLETRLVTQIAIHTKRAPRTGRRRLVRHRSERAYPAPRYRRKRLRRWSAPAWSAPRPGSNGCGDSLTPFSTHRFERIRRVPRPSPLARTRPSPAWSHRGSS